ncbi:exported hypothetical protein [Cupriavidus phytorum]|uniref:Uncharacterized protein n=1 Tax=Cupriavidus taiwanensis TaxID=164546 RepID=A0A975WSC2_9BURK|nr:exported hypothetical protein [Cupriavidus taiwanensis]
MSRSTATSAASAMSSTRSTARSCSRPRRSPPAPARVPASTTDPPSAAPACAAAPARVRRDGRRSARWKHRCCRPVQRLYDGSIQLPVSEPENRHVRPSQPSPARLRIPCPSSVARRRGMRRARRAAAGRRLRADPARRQWLAAHRAAGTQRDTAGTAERRRQAETRRTEPAGAARPGRSDRAGPAGRGRALRLSQHQLEPVLRGMGWRRLGRRRQRRHARLGLGRLSVRLVVKEILLAEGKPPARRSEPMLRVVLSGRPGRLPNSPAAAAAAWR